MSVQTVFLICSLTAYQDMFPSLLKDITEKMEWLYILWLLCGFCIGEYEIRGLLEAFSVFPTAFVLVGWFLLNVHLNITSGTQLKQTVPFLYFPISLSPLSFICFLSVLHFPY